MPNLPRRLAAETLGTAMLLATVIGAGLMAESLADGNVALALLAISACVGAILFIAITVIGPLSGAHFNPAVTLVFWLRGEIDRPAALGYLGAQLVGAFLGVWVAHLMFALHPLQVSEVARTGAGQWFAEAVSTFGLVFAILAGIKARPSAVPALVGFYVAAGHWFTASTCFANPAVTLARGFTPAMTGIDPAHIPAFLAGQIVGALAAHLLARWLLAEACAPDH